MSVKSEIRIPKYETNPKLEIKNKKTYDLEERTFRFAQDVIDYVNKMPKTISNIEIAKQLMRSAGSVGANYIEANEALGKKDFLFHIKISRKEAKESHYWLRLSEPASNMVKTKDKLANEATELTNIFGSIFRKSK